MNVKEWIMRGVNLSREIEELKEAKMRAFYDATSSTQSTSSIDKVQTSKFNKTEEKMTSFTHYSALLDEKIHTLFTVNTEIITAVYKIKDSVSRNILIARYINQKTFDKIADELSYSKKHVIKSLHPKALDLLYEVIECNHASVL